MHNLYIVQSEPSAFEHVELEEEQVKGFEAARGSTTDLCKSWSSLESQRTWNADKKQ